MSDRELEIEISPSGKVTVRTRGIKGPECMDWADLLARIVGREESREKTGEYYEGGVSVTGRQQQSTYRRQG